MSGIEGLKRCPYCNIDSLPPEGDSHDLYAWEESIWHHDTSFGWEGTDASYCFHCGRALGKERGMSGIDERIRELRELDARVIRRAGVLANAYYEDKEMPEKGEAYYDACYLVANALPDMLREFEVKCAALAMAHGENDAITAQLQAERERAESNATLLENGYEKVCTMLRKEHEELLRVERERDAMREHICRECKKVCEKSFQGVTPCHDCQWRSLPENDEAGGGRDV